MKQWLDEEKRERVSQDLELERLILQLSSKPDRNLSGALSDLDKRLKELTDVQNERHAQLVQDISGQLAAQKAIEDLM